MNVSFLIRSHLGQRRPEQCLKTAGRKEPSTQNPMRISFRNKNENDILTWNNLRDFHCQQTFSKIMLKEILQREEKLYQNRRKATEMVNIIDYFSLPESLKFIWGLQAKTILWKNNVIMWKNNRIIIIHCLVVVFLAYIIHTITIIYIIKGERCMIIRFLHFTSSGKILVLSTLKKL